MNAPLIIVIGSPTPQTVLQAAKMLLGMIDGNGNDNAPTYRSGTDEGGFDPVPAVQSLHGAPAQEFGAVDNA